MKGGGGGHREGTVTKAFQVISSGDHMVQMNSGTRSGSFNIKGTFLGSAGKVLPRSFKAWDSIPYIGVPWIIKNISVH